MEVRNSPQSATVISHGYGYNFSVNLSQKFYGHKFEEELPGPSGNRTYATTRCRDEGDNLQLTSLGELTSAQFFPVDVTSLISSQD